MDKLARADVTSGPNRLPLRPKYLWRPKHEVESSTEITLRQLPDEILLQIVSNLSDHTKGRWALYNLCLTCERLGPIAREVMVRAPVLAYCETMWSLPAVPSLIMFMAKYERLREVTRSLRVEIGDNPFIVRDYFRRPHRLELKIRIEDFCTSVISSTSFGGGAASRWIEKIREADNLAYIGVLLALLPKLEHLELIPRKAKLSPELGWLFGASLDCQPPLASCPGLSNLKSLKLFGDHPIKGMNSLPNLKALDLHCNRAFRHHLSSSYNLTELRLSTSMDELRGPDRTGRDGSFLRRMKRFLPRIHGLRTFILYDETLYSKNVDTLATTDAHGAQRPILFDHLLHPVAAAHPHLRTLGLPGSWYQSDRDLGRLIRVFPAFPELRHLEIPKCAVLGETPLSFDQTVFKDMPESLEHVRITQADPIVCMWLLGLFARDNGPTLTNGFIRTVRTRPTATGFTTELVVLRKSRREEPEDTQPRLPLPLPNLKQIDLIIDSSPDRVSLEDANTMRRSAAIQALGELSKEAGIRLTLHYRQCFVTLAH